MSEEFELYQSEYLAQKMSLLEEDDGGIFGAINFDSISSSVWGLLLYAWSTLFTWFDFLWQTAVVIVCVIAVLVACCTCYSLYLALSNCYCPQLVTFQCLCPWLSLKRLQKRFALVSQPGLLKTAPKRAGLPPVIVQPSYPPTEVERALIERIAGILREQVAEVGDGV